MAIKRKDLKLDNRNMSIQEIVDNLDQLKKFCERKSVSRWKEDVDMWTKYVNTIDNAIYTLMEEL